MKFPIDTGKRELLINRDASMRDLTALLVDHVEVWMHNNKIKCGDNPEKWPGTITNSLAFCIKNAIAEDPAIAREWGELVLSVFKQQPIAEAQIKRMTPKRKSQSKVMGNPSIPSEEKVSTLKKALLPEWGAFYIEIACGEPV